MTEGLWAAVIGVGGTLLGTFLGWILGKIDFGKIHIGVLKADDDGMRFNCRDYNDEYIPTSLEITFRLNIVNTSLRNKALFNLNLLFVNKHNEQLFKVPIKDLNDCVQYDTIMGPMNISQEATMVNVFAHAGTSLHARIYIDNYEKWCLAKKVYLTYINKELKNKKILVRLADNVLINKEQEDGQVSNEE